jgi:hypothetical protein
MTLAPIVLVVCLKPLKNIAVHQGGLVVLLNIESVKKKINQIKTKYLREIGVSSW